MTSRNRAAPTRGRLPSRPRVGRGFQPVTGLAGDIAATVFAQRECRIERGWLRWDAKASVRR
ncbi:hypothetical protein K8O92_25030 [Nocardia asteroides]|nr:hypothetical protein [Streptomyces gardneri]UAK31091.1 hypothetical protein K8O92_25030 [Nocardia asteroides]